MNSLGMLSELGLTEAGGVGDAILIALAIRVLHDGHDVRAVVDVLIPVDAGGLRPEGRGLEPA